MGVLARFLNRDESFAELVNQFVTSLFQVLGDALGPVKSATVRANAISVLKVG